MSSLQPDVRMRRRSVASGMPAVTNGKWRTFTMVFALAARCVTAFRKNGFNGSKSSPYANVQPPGDYRFKGMDPGRDTRMVHGPIAWVDRVGARLAPVPERVEGRSASPSRTEIVNYTGFGYIRRRYRDDMPSHQNASIPSPPCRCQRRSFTSLWPMGPARRDCGARKLTDLLTQARGTGLTAKKL